MKKNDGGPAFPTPVNEYEEQNEGWEDYPKGMSLRDWFAGQALSGWMSSPAHKGTFLPADDAKYLYQVADAMIAERARDVENHQVPREED